MHPSVKQWVGEKVKEHGLSEKATLEVGARNVNGSVREFFRARYVGMDMQEGTGVDVVARSDAIPFQDGEFEVVVSTEMLEHDPYPWKTLPEMARVCEPGGVVILTCRGVGFHDDPNPKDYWRFTVDSITHLFELAGLHPVEVVPDTDPSHEGVFGLARKPASRMRRRRAAAVA